MSAPELVYAPPRTRTRAQMKRAAAARKLLPDVKTLRERYPDRYREETNPKTGKREWVVDVPLRDLAGNRTKDSHDLQDMLAPHARASGRRPDPEPTDVLIDAAGNRQFVNPALVESTRKRTGWRLPYKATVIEPGAGGMLFRLTRTGWEPTGRWCMGTPWTQGDRPAGGRKDGTMRCQGLQRDPSGDVWRGLGPDGWQRMDPPRLVRRKR